MCNPDHYWQLPNTGPLSIITTTSFRWRHQGEGWLFLPVAYLNRYQTLVRTRTQACLILLTEHLLIQRLATFNLWTGQYSFLNISPFLRAPRHEKAEMWTSKSNGKARMSKLRQQNQPSGLSVGANNRMREHPVSALKGITQMEPGGKAEISCQELDEKAIKFSDRKASPSWACTSFTWVELLNGLRI